jgi:hypothetical protein
MFFSRKVKLNVIMKLGSHVDIKNEVLRKFMKDSRVANLIVAKGESLIYTDLNVMIDGTLIHGGSLIVPIGTKSQDIISLFSNDNDLYRPTNSLLLELTLRISSVKDAGLKFLKKQPFKQINRILQAFLKPLIPLIDELFSNMTRSCQTINFIENKNNPESLVKELEDIISNQEHIDKIDEAHKALSGREELALSLKGLDLKIKEDLDILNKVFPPLEWRGFTNRLFWWSCTTSFTILFFLFISVMTFLNNPYLSVIFFSFLFSSISIYILYFLYRFGFRRYVQLDIQGFKSFPWRHKVFFSDIEHLYLKDGKFYLIYKKPTSSMIRFIPSFYKSTDYVIRSQAFDLEIFEKIIHYYKRIPEDQN